MRYSGDEHEMSFCIFSTKFFISLNIDEVIGQCLWLIQNVDFDWSIVCWYIELIYCAVSEIESANISVRLETSSSGSQPSMNDSANSMSVRTLICDFSTFYPVINSTKHDLGTTSTITSNSSLRTFFIIEMGKLTIWHCKECLSFSVLF